MDEPKAITTEDLKRLSPKPPDEWTQHEASRILNARWHGETDLKIPKHIYNQWWLSMTGHDAPTGWSHIILGGINVYPGKQS